MADDILREIQKRVDSYLDNYPNLNKPLIIIDLDDLSRFDTELATYFFNPKFAQSVMSAFRNTIIEKRKDFTESPFNINYLPHDQMEYKYISDLSHEDIKCVFRVNGFIESISATQVLTKCTFKCPACHKFNQDNKKFTRCQTCNTAIEEHEINIIRKSFRDFEFQESYDYRQVSESIMCRIELSVNPEGNLFDIQSMLGKKLDMLVVLDINEGKKRSTLFFNVIGLRDAKVQDLTSETKEQVDEFIKLNEDNILDILRENIWHDHKGDDAKLKVIILCTCGLNQKDNQLGEDKSKQMSVKWTGGVGKGKTQIMKRLAKYHENSTMVGKNTTETGLLGGCDRNQFGQFVFKMGELPRCNNGVLFGDEVGMWSEDLLNSISEQMSDETITFTKIIKARHRLFINKFFAGNPPEGTYDKYKTVFENMGGTPQINDRITAQLISKDDDMKEDEFKDILFYSVGYKQHQKTLSDFFIRAIIKRNSQRPNPDTDKYHTKIATETFMKIGSLKPKDSKGYDADAFNHQKFKTRQFLNFYRVIKSLGRLRNHQSTTEKDIEDAWNLMVDASYNDLLEDYGEIDLEKFGLKGSVKPKPQSDRDLARYIMEQLKRCNENPKKLNRIELHQKVVGEWGINEMTLENVLQSLSNQNEITLNARHDEIHLLE